MVSGKGTVSYGSIVFDGYISSKVTSHPVYDEAQRTVAYVEHEFTINAKVTSVSDQPINTTMEQWRIVLMTPALEFHYDNHGYGVSSMTVNLAADPAITDVAWGPHPLSLDFTPLGDMGALVTWRVIVRIPACPSIGKTLPPALVAVNFEQSWDINDEGLTNLVTSGYLEIPMTRQAGKRTIRATADEYRDKITPKLMYGFTRTQRFRLSKDKRRLDFTFTDSELSHPFPANVVKATGTYSCDSDISTGFNIWKCTISANFVMARDAPKGNAYNRFLLMVSSRLTNAKRVLAEIKHPGSEPKHGIVLPQNWSFSEDLFSSSSRFAFSFQVMGVGIDTIIEATGIWQRMDPAINFHLWKTSISGLQSNRGTARLAGLPTDDLIIDLCLDREPKMMDVDEPVLIGGFQEKRGKADGPASSTTSVAKPSKNAWLKWDNALVGREYNKVAQHKPLIGTAVQMKRPSPPPPTVTSTTDSGFSGGGANKVKFDEPGKGPVPTVAVPKVKDRLQTVAVPTYQFTMTGYAVRLGMRVPAPKLTYIGGLPATQRSAEIGEKVLGAVGGMPIYMTWWNILYTVLGAVDSTQAMANPVATPQTT